jgi:hypothetical protein
MELKVCLEELLAATPRGFVLDGDIDESVAGDWRLVGALAVL